MGSGKATPTTILNELNRAVKMHNFYPSGHPHFKTALSQCVDSIRRCLSASDELKYSISPKGFEFQSQRIGADSGEIADLAKKFFLRKIKELSITSMVTEGDIQELVTALRMEPAELSSGGGAERFFAERGVEGLLLNEMRYEDLKKLKTEIEQDSKDAEILSADSEQEYIDNDNAEGEERIEQEKSAGTNDETLQRMIDKIRVETDFLKFNDLSVRIRERCGALIAINALEDAVPALFVFLELSNAEPPKPKDFVGIADSQLKGLLRSESLLRYLTERIGSKEEIERELIQQCILLSGDSVINILLDKAVQAPEAAVRRNIFDTLLLFKERLLPYIEERIKSGAWYEVRQIAALLGDIGKEDNIHLLEEIYTHENIKVKKEALKSLARIPSAAAARLLNEALSEEDTSLATQAIVSIGSLGDPSAQEAIAKIAVKWTPFAKSFNMQKEAIKALGNIGGDVSVTTLTQILMRKSWFGKQDNEELRELAAKSLGKIDNEEARMSLKTAMRSSEGALYATCKRSLEIHENKA